MSNKRKRMGNKLFLGIWIPVLIIPLLLLIAVYGSMESIRPMLNQYAGKGDLVVKAGKGSEDWNKEYYTLTDGLDSGEDVLDFAKSVTEEIAAEGFVLLKNNKKSLPLISRKLTLLGRDSVDPFYGGTGSGGTILESVVTPKEGLEKAGFEINESAYNFFLNNYNRYDRSIVDYASGIIDKSTYFIGEIDPSEYDFSIDGYNNTAVVFIGRSGGEGLDLSKNLKESAETTASKEKISANSGTASEVEQYVDGEHQLELNRFEKDMLAYAGDNFENVVVVINSSNIIEMGDLENNDNIDSILWIGNPGMTGFNALGDVLTGDVNPSGRTVDIYPADFTKDPTFVNFGVFRYSDIDETSVSAGSSMFYGVGEAYMTELEEGIYIGYRYYETAHSEALKGNYSGFDYDSAVIYPFGYGLSYSEFDQKIASHGLSSDGKSINVTVNVTNTGDVAGKDVVQLYYSAPYNYGSVEKSSVLLGDFSKTDLLAPGESQMIDLSIKVEDMASYDYLDNRSYILDMGEYIISLRENSHDVIESFTYKQSEDVIFNDTDYGKRDSDQTVSTNQFDNVSSIMKDSLEKGYARNMSRKDFAGTFPSAPVEADLVAAGIVLADGTTVKDGLAKYDSTNVLDNNDKAPVIGKKNNLALIDFRGKDYNDPEWEELLDQLVQKDYSSEVLCNAAYTTPMVDSVEKPRTIDKDGPAGISSQSATNSVGAETCSYPSEVLLASSFNRDIAYKMGEAVGNESLNTGVNGWYAPAVNTHRSPFAGRNFEYYSEDGVLSGEMASSVIEGCADKGLIVYLKHFALNDMENNRTATLCTWATEQTIREIYLKPFEIAVKDAKTEIRYIRDSEGHIGTKEIGATLGIMSSFNRIGTTWAGGLYELQTTVLRDEWGFEGVVISDFNLYNHMDPEQGMLAGTDMQLTYPMLKSFSENIKHPTIQIGMRKAIKNMLYATVNSSAVNGLASGDKLGYSLAGWEKILYAVTVILVLFIISGIYWVIHRVRKNR